MRERQAFWFGLAHLINDDEDPGSSRATKRELR